MESFKSLWCISSLSMKERIIKTYESFNLDDLDLGKFSEKIDKSLLIPNADGTFDYKGDLYFKRMDIVLLTEIPIRFKNVFGYFDVEENRIISLEGSPEKVHSFFNCMDNYLTSLCHAPKFVGDGFYCNYNRLLSREYTTEINGDFSCSDNPFKITDKVIDSIGDMTIEQIIPQLDFFGKHDKNAYEMMLEILDDLGIGEEIKHRKEFKGIIDENPNAKDFF